MLQLGRYTILKHLASGSIADVLLARASGLEGFARHVVVKRIKPELAKEDRFAKAFLDEARISASLNHHNIVQVHDIGEQDGSIFFAMEYVHGEDVRTILAKVRERGEVIPLEIAGAIIMSAAAGLHHAHEKVNAQGEKLGIVHRDVAPSNIIVGYDGSVKLVDFGLAKAAQRSTTTSSGTLHGKASYMSPEQCRGETVDRRTDTFGLGIVFYELITVQRLFKGPTEYATMAAVVDGEIPPPSRSRADVPPALDAIMLRALARNVAERYQTAEAFRAAVEAFSVDYELRASNKALADYMVRLFGQRPEPWQAGGDRGEPPLTEEDTLSGRGMAIMPPVLPSKDKETTATAVVPKSRAASPIVDDHDDIDVDGDDDDENDLDNDNDNDNDDDDEAFVDEAGTLVMPAGDQFAAMQSDRAQTENEESSHTVVEALQFEQESDTQQAGDTDDAVSTVQNLARPLGRRPRIPAHTPTVPSAPPPHMPPPSPEPGQSPFSQDAQPGGAYSPGDPQPWTPVFPPARSTPPHIAIPPAPVPGSPAPYVQLSAFVAKLRAAFVAYKRPIVFGGGAGVAVILLMVIIMKACGGSDEAPAAAVPDATSTTAPATAPAAAPAPAPSPSPSGAPATKDKRGIPHPARRGSGSAR